MKFKVFKNGQVGMYDENKTLVKTYKSYGTAWSAQITVKANELAKTKGKAYAKKWAEKERSNVWKNRNTKRLERIYNFGKPKEDKQIKQPNKQTKKPKDTIKPPSQPTQPTQPTKTPEYINLKHSKEMEEYQKSGLQEVETTLQTIKQNKDYQEYKNYMIAEKEKVASLDKQSEAFVQRETNNYLQGISNETIKSMLRPYIVDFLRKVGPEIGQEVLNDPMLQPQTARYQTKTGTSRTKTNYHKIYDLLGLGRYGQSDSAMEELSGLLFEVANRLGYISDEQLEDIRTTIDNANNDIGLDFGTYNIYD